MLGRAVRKPEPEYSLALKSHEHGYVEKREAQRKYAPSKNFVDADVKNLYNIYCEGTRRG